MERDFDLSRISAQTLVRRIEHHPTLASTNDTGLERLRCGAAADLPLLILTDRQTRGRGRGDRAWWAAEGGLTFSLVLALDRQQLPVAGRSWLSLAAALAVADAIGELLLEPPAGLKWPNDVYLNGRKVCGILVESPGQPADHAVVGIGLNVNNRFTAAPPELQERAISLADAAGGAFDLTAVLVCLLQHLDRTLAGLASGLGETGPSGPNLQHLDQAHSGRAQQPESIVQRWRERCLLTGRQVRVKLGMQSLCGRCLGVDEQGRLLVQTDAGIRRCASGSVEEFGPPP